ncbi:hypothetical protein KVP40.0182 [Vibrio phage KVP40]|uniref:Uncharacterized protein n=2 Tax=Schizotequatrovirus KVP40 TaxID=1914019 RepID=Q6WHX2_BPKVM|nr:hypothetical protein KVP40.0182 [Vibrio phage KVP40]QIW91232.1 hypothetical protein COHAPHLL_00396 [Vibrio phage V09]UNA01699.1 hypothetical protein [Vibrio phage PC-Liy1]URQ02995.1 hypothetical protein PVA8_9 [Vibrio phage PVA8]WBM58731.1 hypothetical protein vBValMPVA8_9 [Vibrio phage vB_ValM_PVA8]WOL24715.1 hypothetical protein [Vibrio phage PG216]
MAEEVKDYDRAVVVINYKSGRAVAFWVYSFTHEETMRGASVEWHSATNPLDEKESNELRERLARQNIALLEDPVRLATDVSDIESIWVAERYLGQDGEIPEDE